MDLFELTRALIEIDSTTQREKQAGEFLFAHLCGLAAPYSGHVEKLEVEPERFNVFARWGEPRVTLSSHMDTVPPHFPPREDGEHIWGRGACDAKGIVAAMIVAAEELLRAGTRNFALLFVVGEERNSAGAIAAARTPRGSRFLINGEPTENKLALGSKGALRLEIETHGRMAHSAYPELGHSAIEDLLDVLQDIRRIPLPEDNVLGRSTLNIGTISGGCAPNVVADSARAEIMFRLTGEPAPIRTAVDLAVEGRAEIKEILYTPAIRLASLDGFPTTVVAYTTDIPVLSGAWGRPLLLGPGSIHVAHTSEERVSKRQLLEAVGIYQRMVRQLLAAS